MRYLLDTNVLSDFVRGHERVTTALRAHDPVELAVSTITVMEIEYGLALTAGRRRTIAPVVDAVLAVVTVLPFTREDARAAATVRAALRRRGLPIGPYDVLLAGTALARGLVLVTANVDELSRVTSLQHENWRD